ncbi:MAG: S46 family peptidase [Candidatus Azobacteroides sp.]|nr:S46 family peptidase [Candidatus Azobacteroides sp.]
MRKGILLSLSLSCLIIFAGKAEEGMWLLPQLKEQNLSDMQRLGLQLNVDDIYNPDSTSIKDAIVIFGPGCTGEVISDRGLVLTNHHCGYSYIQDHSSVEQNYLENGFWAKNQEEELPTPDLQVTFIEKIEDVTEYVLNSLKNDSIYGNLNYVSSLYLNQLAIYYVGQEYLDKNPGTTVEIKSFYEDNAYYLFYEKTYSDVRLVGTPPSSVGKFGGETDNWMWPRHTGDFCLFRIYTDLDGNPAEYSEENIPLHPKKYLPISLKGIRENDFSFILGFPGETDRYATSYEIDELKNIINKTRIRIREEKLDIMLAEMLADPEVNIRYASKYSRSSNYRKNSIGMNRCIDKLKVIEKKKKEEQDFVRWAVENEHPEYKNALDSVKSTVEKRSNYLYRIMTLREALLSGVEFSKVPTDIDSLCIAMDKKDELEIEGRLIVLNEEFESFYDKNYHPETDQKIAKRMLSLYAEMIDKKEERPSIFKTIDDKFAGNYDLFVDECFKKSIFASPEKFAAFRKNPKSEILKSDPMIQYARSVNQEYNDLSVGYYNKNFNGDLFLRKYMEGILEKRKGTSIYPDANFSIRLTYGTVKSYRPADAVKYDYHTTLQGVMEKEMPGDREFDVPEKLKQLYENKNFGQYAGSDNELPVCFITTHDITGGNSGSPVIDASGRLIGVAFDGNWESLSGDIIFEPELQRCIAVDIRYVLFILDKFAGAGYLMNEMQIDQ